jgi:hypothetical protein
VFLAAADLLVLRDGAALVLVLPPEQSRPSEGDLQEALRRGDRLSLPRLQLVPRTKCLNWELPESYGPPAGSSDGSLCTGPLVLSHLKPSMLSPSESTPCWAMPTPPDRWHYRSLQLLTTGEAVTDLQLAHHQI